ncbi:hypothetical protein GcC1_185035 [Golovinomyces cichoracearum]|uniref:Secreted effector protein n=1 Tax=Golovinomyces cichoracearum TaxID=62708 RepID=A0A420HL13_9PEZI|nr:hypothetical protein GcC1_185035 [Golovinomyces cichoracearum]
MRLIYYFTIMITIIRNLVCGSNLLSSKPPIKFTLQSIGSAVFCGIHEYPVAEIDEAAKKACKWAISGQSCVSRALCLKTGSLYRGTDGHNTNEHRLVQHRMKSKFVHLSDNFVKMNVNVLRSQDLCYSKMGSPKFNL